MNAKASTQFALTEDFVRNLASELSETASHPEFLNLIQEVQHAPTSKKKSMAEDVARVEQIAARGIPVPETLRITTRTFEDPKSLAPPTKTNHTTPVVAFDGFMGSVAFRDLTISVREIPIEVDRPSSDVIEREIKGGIEAIGDFVSTPAFQDVLSELAELEEEARPQFVVDELLQPARRAERGLVVPTGMLIQRSQFADNRPTLFCVSKVLPLAYPWHKVTITFDNP